MGHFLKKSETVYTRGKSLQRFQGGKANHFDVKTDDLYWICAPKKDGNDRHEAGHGPVLVDDDAADEYRRITSA